MTGRARRTGRPQQQEATGATGGLAALLSRERRRTRRPPLGQSAHYPGAEGTKICRAGWDADSTLLHPPPNGNLACSSISNAGNKTTLPSGPMFLSLAEPDTLTPPTLTVEGLPRQALMLDFVIWVISKLRLDNSFIFFNVPTCTTDTRQHRILRELTRFTLCAERGVS